jgi:hypothetical protein
MHLDGIDHQAGDVGGDFMSEDGFFDDVSREPFFDDEFVFRSPHHDFQSVWRCTDDDSEFTGKFPFTADSAAFTKSSAPFQERLPR